MALLRVLRLDVRCARCGKPRLFASRLLPLGDGRYLCVVCLRDEQQG